jgi:hypothetical protein
MLVKLVICSGAAAVNDSVNNVHNVAGLREALFSQVLSTAYLVYAQVKVRTSQILLLVVSYEPSTSSLLDLC